MMSDRQTARAKVPTASASEPAIPDLEGRNTNIVSRLFLLYLNPLFRLGAERALELSDVGLLNEEEQVRSREHRPSRC
jgi:hypothetical protein